MPDALWIRSRRTSRLVDLSQTWGIPLTDDPALATQKLELSNAGSLLSSRPLLRHFQL